MSDVSCVFSYSAAQFYYQTKYPSYPECSQSCVRMDVEAKFKTKSVFETDPIKSRTTFIFPMEVPVTEEFYTASPLSLGENGISQSKLRIIKVLIHYSRGDRRLPWHVSWGVCNGY